MHRRGLQCIPKRTPRSIPSRCYSHDADPPSSRTSFRKKPLPEKIESNLNTLINRAAAGVHHAPGPNSMRHNKRRSGSSRRGSGEKEPERLALHNYPWRGGIVRQLENSVRKANIPNHVPTVEKQKMSIISEQDVALIDDLDPVAGMDTSNDTIKYGKGAFVELRRYILSNFGILDNLLNIFI